MVTEFFHLEFDREHTQIVFSNFLCFPFPTANFPCANLHNLWLLHVYIELTWQTYPASGKKKLPQISQYPLLLESEHLQLELTKFPVFSVSFDTISKFLVFALTGIFFAIFPVPWVPWFEVYQVSDFMPYYWTLTLILTTCHIVMVTLTYPCHAPVPDIMSRSPAESGLRLHGPRTCTPIISTCTQHTIVQTSF